MDPLIGLFESLRGAQVRFFQQSGNAGDGLIAHATYTMMRRHGVRFRSMHAHDAADGEIILVGGGGNLVEGKYVETAEFIRRHVRRNRLVLLPHTIAGYADVLAHTHDNLKVFCREPVSFELARLNGAHPRQISLAHDMALYLEQGDLPAVGQGEGVLSALRADAESANRARRPADNVDISLSWNGELWQNEPFARSVVESLCHFIAPYRVVRTDRLHVCILSALLGKEVYLFPNSYFKNRAVFQHSISPRFPHVRFVNTDTDLPHSEHIERQVRSLMS